MKKDRFASTLTFQCDNCARKTLYSMFIFLFLFSYICWEKIIVSADLSIPSKWITRELMINMQQAMKSLVQNVMQIARLRGWTVTSLSSSGMLDIDLKSITAFTAGWRLAQSTMPQVRKIRLSAHCSYWNVFLWNFD